MVLSKKSGSLLNKSIKYLSNVVITRFVRYYRAVNFFDYTLVLNFTFTLGETLGA